jgi:hypothetical protein
MITVRYPPVVEYGKGRMRVMMMLPRRFPSDCCSVSCRSGFGCEYTHHHGPKWSRCAAEEKAIGVGNPETSYSSNSGFGEFSWMKIGLAWSKSKQVDELIRLVRNFRRRGP